MASINGIEIKALKQFNDHEGMPIYQGNIYYKGNKLGFWSQSYSGAICDDYEFDTSVLNLAVQQAKSVQKGDKYAYYDLESLLCNLCELKEKETIYKKVSKQGNTYLLVFVVDSKDGYPVGYSYSSYKTRPNLTKEVKEVLSMKVLNSFNMTEGNVKFELYTDLSDFDKIFGDEASAKKEVDIEKERERKKQEEQAKKKAEYDKKVENYKIALKKVNNGRFTLEGYNSERDGNFGNPQFNGWDLKLLDNKTGKFVPVPTYAAKDALEAVIALVCGK